MNGFLESTIIGGRWLSFRWALRIARNPHILKWIAEEVELDHYRARGRFKNLVEKRTRRLTGTPEQEMLK